MTTAHTLDIHLLGAAWALPPAVVALRCALASHLDQEEGDIMGQPAPAHDSAAPWPEGVRHQVQGAIIDASAGLDRDALFGRLAAEVLAASPDLGVLAMVHYSPAYEGVCLWLSTPAEPEPACAKIADEAILDKCLGMSWYDALADDDLLDVIGDKLLPVLLTCPSIASRLEPLASAHRARVLDTRIPTASAPKPKPRV